MIIKLSHPDMRKEVVGRQNDIDRCAGEILDMQGQALRTVTYDILNKFTLLQVHQE